MDTDRRPGKGGTAARILGAAAVAALGTAPVEAGSLTRYGGPMQPGSYTEHCVDPSVASEGGIHNSGGLIQRVEVVGTCGGGRINMRNTIVEDRRPNVLYTDRIVR